MYHFKLKNGGVVAKIRTHMQREKLKFAIVRERGEEREIEKLAEEAYWQ